MFKALVELVVTAKVENIPNMETHIFTISSELKTLEWDILNPYRLINLEINNKGLPSII